ncbi:Flavin-dependent monooxygenase, oxygenase subunit HsaA [Pseudomonas fluorescens]|uniref:Flavin-dependent monooxygenase, oxygenase subunit HsaA n=1 Tax=Pseudomonas fluorescens TaxID=294 RepID=A0A5E7KYP0_PSEFL|nr:acyl-CoA dehydrogenase family protein [Pseudomonas fluorescens]VVM61608.1 Flavin-dependent monooxygenase, oxygenase subunit HsaA [Pseudomonas fluorescens]VVP04767.1 Flavin-dependent monooxygenase, oxygenase subunit HsaA [Pseudomonas fluorescens]
MHSMREKTQDERDLLERARSLVPALKARTAQADKDQKVPVESIVELQAAGLLRALQPKEFGGYEVDPRTFFEIQTILAEGCMSTAWIYGVMGVHPWQLARYPIEAQREVWADDHSTLISSTYMPAAKVTVVEGGYRISGRWGFSSGSEHCQWVFLGGILPPDGELAAEHGTFLLPRREYQIERNWDVLGLRGTGSHDIVVEDVFVPSHRVQRTNNWTLEATPGRLVNTNPIYAIPFAQVFSRAVSTSAIGALQGAINEFRDNAAKHIGKHGARTADDPVAQTAIAEAMITVDSLRLVLERNYEHLMSLARAGEYPDTETRLLYRYQSAYVTNICAERVDDLLRSMAASGLYNTNPVARLFRDLHQARGHIANNYLAYGRSYGAVMLGLPNPDPYV